MAKYTRKGRNPGPVDSWLDDLGYYRKNVAHDETCLFRAVSEQIYHERIRKECIEYGRQNFHEFYDLIEDEESWNSHLDQLEKHMAVCGTIEIHLINRLYKKDVMIFDSTKRQVLEIRNFDGSDCLGLCSMGEDHYDVVYKREYIETAGFCQSIVYKTLYENVFEIPNVSKIVQVMLYEKPALMMSHDEYLSNECVLQGNEISELTEKEDKESEAKKQIIVKSEVDHNNLEQLLQPTIIPFPFKVAKALDPTIYRNIEYDTWTEMRKELRLGDWYYGDSNLILGACCLLNTGTNALKCYIQNILKKENKCVVYITSLAEKRMVNYSDLVPETDAKPWPLPYRFSKHSLILPTKLELPNKEKRGFRKRSDKSKSNGKNNTDSGPSPGLKTNNNADASVSVYEGCPLQMQTQEESTKETLPEINGNSIYQDEILPAGVNWDQNSPNNIEPVTWHQGPPISFTYPPKPMATSPEEMPYSDQSYYYNHYQVWPDSGEYPTCDSQVSNLLESPQPCNPYSYPYYPENVYPIMERPICTTPLTPPSPQLEVLQPIYTVPGPGTPVIYTPPELRQLMIPVSPHAPLYSPRFDVPFLAQNSVIYPPTPPISMWYPSVNSHGFIFPTIGVQNVHNNV